MPVRNQATSLTRGLRQKDFGSEARKIFEFCRDNIRYVKDIYGVETLHDPVTLLRIGQGDCDDKSILMSSLLGSIGHRTRFIAVSFVPGQYSHVWTQVMIYGKWVDLEATEPLQFGERIPSQGAVKHIYMDV